MLFRPQKKKFLQTLKNRHFAKGLVHGFGKKSNFFSYFFFDQKKNQKEAFFDIRERKECFLDMKSEVQKK